LSALEKKMMRSPIIAAMIACMGLLYACERSELDTPERTLNITLHKCSNPAFSGNRISLCFDSVLTDSRCPFNAMCFWQGYAACKFSLSSNGETYPFALSTLKLPNIFSKDTIISGYKIEFINLEPYPGTVSYPVPESKIKAEVKITKL
jgi:hypothetical protein